MPELVSCFELFVLSFSIFHLSFELRASDISSEKSSKWFVLACYIGDHRFVESGFTCMEHAPLSTIYSLCVVLKQIYDST